MQALSKTCLVRLKKEYQELIKEPIPQMRLYVNPGNILRWYFCIYNLNCEEYSGGQYYGYIEMHHNYPYKPPSYYMLTPNGRFEVEKSICTTNSSFHQGEWNPLWTLDTLFRGFLSLFMEDNTGQPLSVNHVQSSVAIKKEYAHRSQDYNVKNLSNLYRVFFTDSQQSGVIIHPSDIKLKPDAKTPPTEQIQLVNPPTGKIKLKLKSERS